MKILAIEFSSIQRSVAVVQEGAPGVIPSATRPGDPAVPVAEKAGPASLDAGRSLPTLTPSRQLAEVIETGPEATRALALAEDALRQAGIGIEQVDCLAIGLGPGSYTGVRAAIALAQGWQLARGTNLLGLSSADCIAAAALAEGLEGRVSVVIDAQRGEFYLASYNLSGGHCREVLPLRLASQSEVHERVEAGDALIGPEVTHWFPEGRLVFPRAAVLGRLAVNRQDFVPGARLEPIYLRPTAFVKAAPRRIIT